MWLVLRLAPCTRHNIFEHYVIQAGFLSAVCSFLLNSVPLCGHLSLFIHSSPEEHWVVPRLWYLGIELLSIHVWVFEGR
jgi:hypothetical protein